MKKLFSLILISLFLLMGCEKTNDGDSTKNSLFAITANYRYAGRAIVLTGSENIFQTVVAIFHPLKEEQIEELYNFNGNENKKKISKTIKYFEKKRGFIPSYKVQSVKNGKFTLKEKPGLFDGIKNGIISIWGLPFHIIKAPFYIVKYIIKFDIKSIFNYIVYFFLSVITRFLALFFMRASLLYYIGFIVGLAVSISPLAVMI